MSLMEKGAPSPNIGRNRAARPINPATRLWFALLLSNLSALFAAVMISKRVGSFTLDPAHEPYWIGVGYALMFIAAVADAFWADELFFKGAFRRVHLRGQSLARAEKQGDVEGISASLRPMQVIFPILVVAGLVVSYVSCNAISRGFFSDYDRVGEPAKIARTTDPTRSAERKAAIEKLSMVQRPQVQLFLARQLRHPDEETAAYAAWALGRLRNKNARRMFSDDLMRAAKSKSPMLAKEAQLALARMQHRPVGPMVEQRLSKALVHIGDDLDPRLVWALGFTQHASAIPVLAKALYHPDATVRRVAAWALGQQKGQKNAERALKVLQERLLSAPLPTRCAVVHAMGILGHERANLAIVSAWERATPEERGRYCEGLELPLRPDKQGLDRHKLLLTPVKHTVESYEVMSLFSMGAIAAQTDEVKSRVLGMIEQILADADAKPRSKEAASSLKAGIEKG